MSSEENLVKVKVKAVNNRHRTQTAEAEDDGSSTNVSKESSSTSSLSPSLHNQYIHEQEHEQEEAPIPTDHNHRNNMSNLTTLSQQLQATNQLLSDQLKSIEEQVEVKQSKVDSMHDEMRQLQSRLADLNQEEQEQAAAAKLSKNTDNDNSSTHEIESLLMLYERLKADEKLFKQSCNSELERLQSLLEQTVKSTEGQGSDADLQMQLEKAERRIEIGREELGVTNRRLGLIQRQIEQIPNRVELREYRLRFTELYNQVSATHRQTKQYFSLYNSLQDSKRYLEKEHSLLNSIIDSYQQIGSTASGREQLLKQLSAIHEGITETCSKIDRRYKSEKVVVDKLQHDLQNLLDQKVNYEKCLKELDMECKLNDKLLLQLKQSESEEQRKVEHGQ